MRRALLLAVVTLGFFAGGCLTLTELEPDHPSAIHVHERLSVAGTELAVRFVAVTGDSRCAVDVQCIWAGDAVVQLDLLAPADSVRADLHVNSSVGASAVAFHGYDVALVALDPAPHSGQAIDPDAYVATLKVRKK